MLSDNFHQHLKNVIQWHFSPETGSPFWLKMLSKFDFDPINDINTFSDLSLFPDVSLLLRDISVEELQPKGLTNLNIAGVFESGGTTGPAKRVIVYEAWLEQQIRWRQLEFQNIVGNDPQNLLAIIPNGPHLVGAINQRRAKALGGQYFTVDLDPRWVKILVKNDDFNAVNSYIEHLIDQAEAIIRTQSISVLVTTPPLLEAISRRRSLREYLNNTLKMIIWGGVQIDVDTLDYLNTVIFPNVTLTASYGNTMILSENKARIEQYYDGSPIFDSYVPYVTLEVVDPETRKPVPYYERGQVIMNHLSKFAFFPNILERDTAIRLPSLLNHDFGSAVCEVKTVSKISENVVIEGVY